MGGRRGSPTRRNEVRSTLRAGTDLREAELNVEHCSGVRGVVRGAEVAVPHVDVAL